MAISVAVSAHIVVRICKLGQKAKSAGRILPIFVMPVIVGHKLPVLVCAALVVEPVRVEAEHIQIVCPRGIQHCLQRAVHQQIIAVHQGLFRDGKDCLRPIVGIHKDILFIFCRYPGHRKLAISSELW